MEAILAGGRIGLVFVGALGLLALAPGAGYGRCDTGIRVLVARSASRGVELSVDGTRRRITRSGSAVRVDGGPAQARWESGAVDSARVGALRLAGRLSALVHAGEVVVVNEVSLERYVAGAIGGEMPPGWATPALRAQAVASRTYALHQRRVHRNRPWHVASDTSSQVYRGVDVPGSVRRAAADTRCQVLMHGGEPILAAFHSASGGRTASAAEVWGEEVAYLKSLDVAGEDDSPDTYWRAAVSRSTLGRVLGAAGHPIGAVAEATVEDRSESGRVRQMRFRGERGEVRLSGRQLRTALGESTLRSTLFELRTNAKGFVFVGSGRGHGVGMSQWGARSLAERGASYRKILESFYPGTTLGLWKVASTMGER